MIAGSVASTTYGLTRSTQDIDVVIDPRDLAALEALVKSMPADAYYADLEAASDAWHRRSKPLMTRRPSDSIFLNAK